MATWVRLDNSNGSDYEYYDLDKALRISLNRNLGSIVVSYPGISIVISSIMQPNAYNEGIAYLQRIEASRQGG